MKTHNVMTIGSVALGTAILTVLAFWSPSLEAGRDGDALAAKIANPKLVSNGIEMTVVAAGTGIFSRGDEPVFELRAVNTGKVATTVAVTMAMTATSPADKFSRVPVMPSRLWFQENSFTLKPHETKVIAFATHTQLPANKTIAVSLEETGAGDELREPGVQPANSFRETARRSSQPVALPSRIVALNFSTVTSSRDPAVALKD